MLLREGEAWWSETGAVGRDVPPRAPGWRRLAAMEAVPPAAGHVSVSPVAAAVVAGQAVADLGAACPEHPGCPAVRACTWWIWTGAARVRTPFCRTCRRCRPARGASAGPLGEKEFSRRAARLMDSRTGVFAEIEEGEYGQLPLHVSVTMVADPMGALGGAGAGERSGGGLRRRAIPGGAEGSDRARAARPRSRRLVTAEGTPVTGAGEPVGGFLADPGAGERPGDGLLDDPLMGDPLVGDVAAGGG
ncbi:hypothetical protein [Nonomuraea angiospora]|uniref:hypothetical protein n=1 Tax=Nonomuraea angiospora TaxID=46172 RepID=UPI0029BB9F8E|nr:hypothetical protein [Nonomuraea angiospora]MDX3105936.1 hypothetical protein [Nonomuraea angiospora]